MELVSFYKNGKTVNTPDGVVELFSTNDITLTKVVGVLSKKHISLFIPGEQLKLWCDVAKGLSDGFNPVSVCKPVNVYRYPKNGKTFYSFVFHDQKNPFVLESDEKMFIGFVPDEEWTKQLFHISVNMGEICIFLTQGNMKFKNKKPNYLENQIAA